MIGATGRLVTGLPFTARRVSHGDEDRRGPHAGRAHQAQADGLAVTLDGDATQHQGLQGHAHGIPPDDLEEKDGRARAVAGPE
jgi:hypothetical protein